MAEQGARDCASRHHTTQEAGRDYCRRPSASATAATIAVARSARQISKQASRQIEQLASSDRRASMPRPLEAQCTVSSSCRCRRIPPNLGSAPFVPPPPAVILLPLPSTSPYHHHYYTVIQLATYRCLSRPPKKIRSSPAAADRAPSGISRGSAAANDLTTPCTMHLEPTTPGNSHTPRYCSEWRRPAYTRIRQAFWLAVLGFAVGRNDPTHLETSAITPISRSTRRANNRRRSLARLTRSLARPPSHQGLEKNSVLTSET